MRLASQQVEAIELLELHSNYLIRKKAKNAKIATKQKQTTTDTQKQKNKTTHKHDKTAPTTEPKNPRACLQKTAPKKTKEKNKNKLWSAMT